MTVTTTPPSPGNGGTRTSSSRAGSRAEARRARREPSLLGRFLGYLGYFVGTGLLSGAIVHYPLAPARYSLIAVIGAVLFLVAALAAEMRQPGRLTALRIVAVLGTSLALSFGVGMLTGGMQHFEDFPARAAVLIPAGLLLSFVAFALKEARSPLRRILGPLGLAVLVISAVAYVGLHRVAAAMPAEPAGHHHGPSTDDGHDDGSDGHDHQHTDGPSASAGSDPGTPPSAAAAPTPTPTPGAASKSAASPSVPPHGSPGHHH